MTQTSWKRLIVGHVAELTDFTVKGTLKGYDALMNLVLDDVEEVLRGITHLSPTSARENPRLTSLR